MYLPRARRGEDRGFGCVELKVMGGDGEAHEADDNSESLRGLQGPGPQVRLSSFPPGCDG